MQGLPSILSLFRNEFNKFNNTRARMLEINLYDIKIIMKSYFWHDHVRFCNKLDVEIVFS